MGETIQRTGRNREGETGTEIETENRRDAPSMDVEETIEQEHACGSDKN
jgi:hypothetical protein